MYLICKVSYTMEGELNINGKQLTIIAKQLPFIASILISIWYW